MADNFYRYHQLVDDTWGEGVLASNIYWTNFMIGRTPRLHHTLILATDNFFYGSFILHNLPKESATSTRRLWCIQLGWRKDVNNNPIYYVDYIQHAIIKVNFEFNEAVHLNYNSTRLVENNPLVDYSHSNCSGTEKRQLDQQEWMELWNRRRIYVDDQDCPLLKRLANWGVETNQYIEDTPCWVQRTLSKCIKPYGQLRIITYLNSWGDDLYYNVAYEPTRLQQWLIPIIIKHCRSSNQIKNYLDYWGDSLYYGWDYKPTWLQEKLVSIITKHGRSTRRYIKRLAKGPLHFAHRLIQW